MSTETNGALPPAAEAGTRRRRARWPGFAGFAASLPTVAREWGRIGCIGFGGPPAHIALLRSLCVDRRRWLDAAEFEDAIAACNLLPGPASTELAILCAWRVRGRLGALVGGAAFIVPGLIVILALSVLFLAGTPPRWVTGLGAGAGSAVAAVAIQAGLSLVKPSWRRAAAADGVLFPGPPPAASLAGGPGTPSVPSAGAPAAPAVPQPAGEPADPAAGPLAPRPARSRRARWVGYLVAGGVAAPAIGPWLVLVLLGCGLAELAIRPRAGLAGNTGRPEDDAAPQAGLLAPLTVLAKAVPAKTVLAKTVLAKTVLAKTVLAKTVPLGQTAAGATVGAAVFGSVAWVAFKVGALSFGGGLVIIPLMQADAVGRHWMTSAQFLNAVALGQITPGPVVQTVAAVGYAAAGVPGGLLASVVAFTPSFLFILFGARYFQAIRTAARPQAFLDGAGPAAIGAILGSAYLLAAALSQPWQFAILAAAVLLLLVARRGVVLTLLCAAAAGLIIVMSGGPVP